MNKLDNHIKLKIVAGYRTNKLSLFNKVLATSMFGESINGVMNLINQIVYYNRSGNYSNQPNHYRNSAPRYLYKIAPYPSGSSMNMSAPWF